MKYLHLILVVNILLFDKFDILSYFHETTSSSSTKASRSLLSTAQIKYCRPQPDAFPHHNAFWVGEFPTSATGVRGLCDGIITIGGDESICVQGRATWEQVGEVVRKQLDKAAPAPGAKTISINGQLTTGTGNAALGANRRYIYDFIANYTVNGITYQPDRSNMTDNLLGGSRGLIDGVCLKPSYVQNDTIYEIIYKAYPAWGGIDIDFIMDSNLVLVGSLGLYAEHYVTLGLGKLPKSSNWFSRISNNIGFYIGRIFPTEGYNFLPVMHDMIGIYRRTAAGKYSTDLLSDPLGSPNEQNIEGLQVETEWRILRTLLEDGLFTKRRLPLFFQLQIKRIKTVENSVSCFNETMVGLDFYSPVGYGLQLDEYVEEVIYPAIVKAGGTVYIHFGKRIPPNTNILQAAINSFEKCGAEVNLKPPRCNHPMCNRINTYVPFDYPPEYFEIK